MRIIKGNTLKNIDWWLVVIYIALLVIGLLNIYSSIHADEGGMILDRGTRSGKQFMWMLISLGFAAMILFVFNPRIYETFSPPIYAVTLLLLIAVIFLGTEIKGSRSWFSFGGVSFQPAEISKIATSLFLSTVMSQYGFRLKRPRDFLIAAAIVLVPMLIIVGQSETGSALVYVGFIFVFYREGLSGWLITIVGAAILLFIVTLTVSPYAAIVLFAAIVSLCNALYIGQMKHWWAVYFPSLLALAGLPFLLDWICSLSENPETFIRKVNPMYILLAVCVGALPPIIVSAFRKRRTFTTFAAITFIAGIILVYSTDFLFNDVLQDHQRKRIEVLLGMKEDPSGVGYNVNQSMIAIGSGGLTGKGYLNGTQTTFGFVPEQSTDFIFCTIGEEWGFLGAAGVVLLYVFLIGRIVIQAEKCKEAFTRIYGYCVACCIFMHLFINIGMTIGIMPVIGIPLPFISYGGSSLLAFTILLFIFIVLESNDKRFAS